MAHGKSTVVKAISGVQTVRFKNELERNITIKLGYANAKIYKCEQRAGVRGRSREEGQSRGGGEQQHACDCRRPAARMGAPTHCFALCAAAVSCTPDTFLLSMCCAAIAAAQGAGPSYP